mmetsp:Transcript_69601/g.215175  ORF Transcript_69601/g.215175 Transcript_69601/m.215175 type:complete len:206 (-) Transcript_69601:425-1042(-)
MVAGQGQRAQTRSGGRDFPRHGLFYGRADPGVPAAAVRVHGGALGAPRGPGDPAAARQRRRAHRALPGLRFGEGDHVVSHDDSILLPRQPVHAHPLRGPGGRAPPCGDRLRKDLPGQRAAVAPGRQRQACRAPDHAGLPEPRDHGDGGQGLPVPDKTVGWRQSGSIRRQDRLECRRALHRVLRCGPANDAPACRAWRGLPLHVGV